MSDDQTRSFSMILDLPASPEQVWRAWTDPAELVRWFPLEAEVKAGAGGSVLWSWGGAWSWLSRIEAWEPGRRLHLVQEENRPFDAQGNLLPAGEVAPAHVALEITLETVAGGTRLRLVHSGFGHGAAWDDEVEGITAGWQVELVSLAHYLRHHLGRDRHARRAQVTSQNPPAEAWQRLLGAAGFAVEASRLEAGAPYSFQAPGGRRFHGTLLQVLPGAELLGSVDELGEGVFRLGAWKASGETGIQAWLCAYRAGEEETLAAFEAEAAKVLGRL
ncbi:MAG TPA: SRPBCC domain-containing protein [Thermoanaerobaculia bacterium]|nr:SRPBCC domain-containing protein [Thermoanaerobaculia bacterium]